MSSSAPKYTSSVDKQHSSSSNVAEPISAISHPFLSATNTNQRKDSPQPAPCYEIQSSWCTSNTSHHQPEENATVRLPSGSYHEHICSGSTILPHYQNHVQECVPSPLGFHPLDIEKGLPELHRVFLSVQGLTCVMCESKLSRSLQLIPTVHNLQTSLVLSRAEFDLDISRTSVGDLISTVENSTGFKCKRMLSKGYYIDVIVNGDLKSAVEHLKQQEVSSVTLVDSHIVRIEYDPMVVGARSILAVASGYGGELAPVRPDPVLDTGRRHALQTGLMTLFSAIMTIPVLVMAWAPLPNYNIAYTSASLVLATIGQFVVVGPFYSSAAKGFMYNRVMEMDFLVVLSTTAAYTFSIVAFACEVKGSPLMTGVFFETSTLLVTFIMLGRFVSAFARQKAVELISIRSLQASKALLVEDGVATPTEIDARLLQHGDIFTIIPDSRIATDAIVISGNSEVDESIITGESRLLDKFPGSSLVAGSLNGSGTLTARVRRLPGQNTISEIAAMVDEAKFSKPKIRDIGDHVASYFVPAIIGLAIGTFGTWIGICVATRHETASSAASIAITYAIAVLIVSCPCAIGLAVPMVVVIAGGVAAKHGVILKSTDLLSIARSVTHVVFDKTGTLTQGRLDVIEVHYPSDSKDLTISLLLAMTANLKHPVSAAIAKYLQDTRAEAAVMHNIRTITCKGIEGYWGNSHIRSGNCRWLGCADVPLVRSCLEKGLTVFCVMRDSELLAVYGLQDTLRTDAVFVVSELLSRGIQVSIVSGDDDGAVQIIRDQLSLSESYTNSACLPSDKQKYVEDLMKKGETVLFCGDGTNDAPALAQANAGVHINEGSDVAQSAADVVLIRPNLGGILVLLELSEASHRRIVLNFVWAFVYNLFAILLAAGAFVIARIPPEYAGLEEIVSVLPVVLIALQLKWMKFS